MHAFVHACVYVCVHTYRNQDNIPKKCMGACRMKLTVSDKPLRHGLELLLLLVQSQRSLCYWVALKQRGQTLFTQRHMCKSHNQELQL